MNQSERLNSLNQRGKAGVSLKQQLLGSTAALQKRRRRNKAHSDGPATGSKVRGLYLPAVDNYRARSTPVALVNLSAMKEEREDGDQAAAADRNQEEDAQKEEDTPASSSLSPKQHRTGRGG